jgi:hypothetical protein
MTSGSAGPTPNIDEDCNGYWDNTFSSGCPTGWKKYSYSQCAAGTYTCHSSTCNLDIIDTPSDCSPVTCSGAGSSGYFCTQCSPTIIYN